MGINFDKTDYYSRIDLGLKYSKCFLFACEESFGYLPYEFVRDKDGNASTIAFCELLSHLNKKGITVIEYLDSIYIKYGYYDQFTLNLFFDGATGADKIKKIVKSYTVNPPSNIGETKIVRHINYGEPGHLDEDQELIPVENFHMLYLENGYSFAVRASGTEPKIKFYIFGNANIETSQKLNDLKTEVSNKLSEIAANLEKDAHSRSVD